MIYNVIIKSGHCEDDQINQTVMSHAMGTLTMMSRFTCGCYVHGFKAAIEASSRIAAFHRAVGLRGVDATINTGGAAANSVPHVRLSHQLIHSRMTR